MSRQVEWRTGRGRKVPAEVVDKRIRKIAARYGECHPQRLVDSARDPEDALHPMFEWDDTIAAERYRVEQARAIAVSIVVVEGERERPAHVSVTQVDEGGVRHGYRPVEDAMADERQREQVLTDALRQAEGMLRRHEYLSELDPIRSAVQEVRQTVRAVA